MMLGMHLIPLTEALQVVRRVDFMLCIFYHQKEKEMEENIKQKSGGTVLVSKRIDFRSSKSTKIKTKSYMCL